MTLRNDSIPIWKEGNVDVCENDDHNPKYLGLGHSAVTQFLHIETEYFHEFHGFLYLIYTKMTFFDTK